MSSNEMIAAAMRRTLDDLDEVEGEVRVAIVLLDVRTSDGNTEIFWNAEPDISGAWVHGILNTAAKLALHGYQED